MTAVGAVAGLAVFSLVGPAFAHVELSADKKTVGAQNVTLTFSGEAERPGAGIRSERVVLPAGIDPASVSIVKAPPGWSFSRTADGFTVGGKALNAGVDAVWKVKVAKLPDGVNRLSFKTLESYSNGDIDRWIEIQQPGEDEPDHPAPLLALKVGPSTAPAATPSTASAAPSVASSASAPAAASTGTPVEATPAASGGQTWWIWLLAAAAAIAVGIALARRRANPTGRS